jgi:hypothetical protein
MYSLQRRIGVSDLSWSFARDLRELVPGIFFGTFTHQPANLQNSCVGDGVQNVTSVAAAADETSVVEILQMSRDIRLIGPKPLRNLADWRFALLKDLQDTQAKRLTQGSKTSGNNFDHAIA